MKRIIDPLISGIRDTAGNLAANAEVYFYDAGTTTLKQTFEDWDLTDPHPNPATLDAAGTLKAYCDGKVRIVVVSVAGATIRDIDHLGTDDTDVAAAATAVQAGAGLIVDGDGQLAVNPDGSTITIASDQITIADDGVGSDEIDDDVELQGDCSVTGSFTVGGASGTEISHVTTSPTLERARIDKALQIKGSSGPIFDNLGTRTVTVKDSSTGTAGALVSSPVPSSHSLHIVRGHVNASGSVVIGEGYSVNRSATGTYDITFTTPFAVAPAVVATVYGSAASDQKIMIRTYNTATTGVTINPHDSGPNDLNRDFMFIAIGQRGA